MSHMPYSADEADKLDTLVKDYRRRMYTPDDLEYNVGFLATAALLLLVSGLMAALFITIL